MAGADAFAEYNLSRRDAVWEVQGLGGDKPLPLFEVDGEGLPDIKTILPSLTLNEDVFEDYVSTRLTLRAHPVELMKPRLPSFTGAGQLRELPNGQWLNVVGLVITRQRPGTASGVIFLTLEDESAVSNIVVWPKVFERYRKSVMAGRLLRIQGRLQREGSITHVIATRIDDYSHLLDMLGDPLSAGGTIDPSIDSMDETKRPLQEDRTGPRPPSAVSSEDITHALQHARQAAYGSGARHPREQAKKLFYSRDFH